jgi:hypothetical protein
MEEGVQVSRVPRVGRSNPVLEAGALSEVAVEGVEEGAMVAMADRYLWVTAHRGVVGLAAMISGGTEGRGRRLGFRRLKTWKRYNSRQRLEVMW